MTTSATGGCLVPAVAPAPLEDTALEDFLQEVFVGLTGLAPDLIRPRWQPEPADLPDAATSWMAFGIQVLEPDTYAAIRHDPTGQGTDEFQRHETIEVLMSSYGPNATKNLSQLRDGIQVAQNREVLQLNGMGLLETGSMIPAPTLVKGTWLRRYDMPFRIRRQIRRSYPVLNILTAVGTINAQNGALAPFEDSINVNP